MPWNASVMGKKYFKYLTLQKVNKKDDIEKIIESIFIYNANKKGELSIAQMVAIVDFIEKNWLVSNSYSSEFTKEIRDLLSKYSRIRPYVKERINVSNFAKFVTRNFDLFTANIDLFTSYRPQYATTFHIKSLIEIHVIKVFLSSFQNFETLIDDEKNKALYLDQIREALKPIEERVDSENAKLSSYMQNEPTLLRHRSISQLDVLYPENFETIVMDRL